MAAEPGVSMSFDAAVYNVMIASPGDVGAERNVAREVIAEWNAVHASARNLVLMPVGWETHSAPTMGKPPQEVINEQVLRNADLLVGIFWTRIGTATSTYPGGTVEEIEEHLKADKPTMLYFSEAPVRADAVATEQYEQLKGFRESARKRGLVEVFSSTAEFREKFNRQLQVMLNKNSYFAGKAPTVDVLAEELIQRLQITTERLRNAPAQNETGDTTAAHERLNDLMIMTHQMQASLIAVMGALNGIKPMRLEQRDAKLVDYSREVVEDTLAVNYGLLASLASEAGREPAFIATDIDTGYELRRLAMRLQRTRGREDVTVKFRTERPTLRIRFDRNVFESVIYNLLENVMSYADPHTEIAVEHDYDRAVGAVVVKIKSIGAPIHPSERESIFERFTRGRSVSEGRLHSGMGLGLWVARKLMRASGGDLRLELSQSHPRLSVFVAMFPLTEASE